MLGKSTYEIHDKLEGEEGHGSARVGATFNAVLVQIVMLDTAFSLDSVITALGMVDELGVMIATVVIAVLVMMVSAEAISGFVNRHPTLKTLALRFFSWSDSCLCWRASKKARASLRSRNTDPGYWCHNVLTASTHQEKPVSRRRRAGSSQ